MASVTLNGIYDSLRTALSSMRDVDFRGDIDDSVFKNNSLRQIMVDLGAAAFEEGSEYAEMSTLRRVQRETIGTATAVYLIVFAAPKRDDLLSLADDIVAVLRTWDDHFARPRGIHTLLSEVGDSDSDAAEGKVRTLQKQISLTLEYDSDKFLSPINRDDS